jgi:hypothetical protein
LNDFFDKDVSGDCDIDIDVEASDDQGHVVSQPGLGDTSCSRSNSRLGLRSVEREAGAETEVEGDGPGLGVVSRLRASPFIDLTDEPVEGMVMDISQPAHSGGDIGVIIIGGDADRVMDDSTVGAAGKRKR